ncbi:TetR/AcrR family transcriptional regulator [Amycolatopsis sp. MtRt-6]|uniref:TetR/AcrR family transcriptional regulator n=1 Tax=Amycolatopsis sp. MtRt-6 TaxID=2792782 RepID=UPI001A8D0EC9|nr:TetR/AcrR family transcriptional regulator [Amycolatopsis sp. MtRt-6]
MPCVECGHPLPPGRRPGRPRRYCSRACQARAYRRRRDHGPAAAHVRPTGSPTVADADPRDRLVRLAVETADAAGLDAVSMRALAERAGMPAHALYRAVRNRSDLLAAMAEHVVGRRMPDHPAPADPRDRLDRLARDEWAMYRGHPWLLAILATNRPPTGPAVLAMADRTIEALTDAGYDPGDAFAAYLTLSAYIQGMALLIDRGSAETPYRTWWSATVKRLESTGRARHHPWLAAVRHGDPGDADADLDAWFDFGLRHLLDGLANHPVRR